ncbi:MAG: guanylate kinase [Bacilli bacterium]|nr:guanylate kinase [Bacilli bacterium]
MVKKKKIGSLIVLSGPSGAGKGTICNKLLEDDDSLNLSISMTTRAPRGVEVDGKDYYFVSRDEFEKRINDGEFLEYAKVHGDNYYGTPKDKVLEYLNNGEDIILEIDIQGALKVKDVMPEGIFIFIMPPSMRELRDRLVKRNTETKDKIIERFKNAYKEINEVTKYNYIVINDEVSSAVEKVKAIILAEKCRVDRIEDFELNNEEELLHELLVDMR